MHSKNLPKNIIKTICVLEKKKRNKNHFSICDVLNAYNTIIKNRIFRAKYQKPLKRKLAFISYIEDDLKT